MVFFNYALRKLNAKIVYYGPGLCGKTTNLQWIHDHFEGGQRGKMISLSTEGDRTIFFDLLPLDIGSIRGMDVTLQLYTVPGQVHYNSTRQLVLRGADGVVFVADSQSTMRSSNIESLRNLEENLSLQGVELEGFPHVLQFNKRDLDDLISIEDMDGDINPHSVPFFEAVATDGVGVQETLEGIVKLVMRSLRERYEPVVAAGPKPPGVGGVPIDLEVPLTPPTARPPVVPVEAVARPYELPAIAELPEEPVGMQDDVPTGVYAEGAPPSDDESDRDLPGAAFWDAAEAASGPTFGEQESGFGMDEPTGSDNFGFAMPFADNETTTDVTELDEGDGQAAAEVLSDSIQEDFALGDAEHAPDFSAPDSPFEVADLTPAPFTQDSVFGGPAEAAGEDVEEHSELFEDETEDDRWRGEAASADEVSGEDLEDVETPRAAAGSVDDLVASFLRPDRSDSDDVVSDAGSDELDSGGWDVEEAGQADDLAWGDDPHDGGWTHDDASATPGDSTMWAGDETDDAGADVHAADDVGLSDDAAAEADDLSGPGSAEADHVDDRVDGELTEGGADAASGGAGSDWDEAHTDELMVDDSLEEEMLPEGAEVAAEAIPEFEEIEPAPFSSGPFTFGDGDPFGDETDDQTTPVRAAVEPQVSVTAPVSSSGALIRPGDNQLHLRLQGTGAIAESGQVRALDIEVPVPGSWVGNRRVTLQLRLTLSPVPEDEDGGQGDAP